MSYGNKTKQELQLEINVLENKVDNLKFQLNHYKTMFHEAQAKILEIQNAFYIRDKDEQTKLKIKEDIPAILAYVQQLTDHQIETGHKMHATEQQKNMLLIRFLTSKVLYRQDILNFKFPCERTMYDYRLQVIQKNINIEAICGACFTSCVQRLKQYRKYHNILAKRKIPVIIATDGCYFNKKMKKDEEGNLTNVIEVIYDDNSVENYAINSGIVYLMVPLCEDLPPLLLFFQLHETGHASADTMNNLLAMKKQLSDNYFPCEGFAKDSDKYWAQHTTSAFEHISNNFYEKQNIDIYRLLSGVEHHLDIQDLLHLSKRIHYRHIKKPIKLQFKLDGLEYDFKKLKDIFNINPQCFQDKPNLKMIDDITLHFYSVKNIQILLERRNVDELFLVMIYFVLVYPLSTVFVKVNDLVFQQMVALSLVTLLRLVSLSTNIKAETVWADDLRNLGENNAKNITHLTFSDQIWMKEAIVSLAQILRLVKKYDSVFIVAVGSYMCENYFSVLRFLSHGNNSASKAEEIIVNKEVLDYCCYETGQDISGTKRSRSKTLVVRKSRILNSEELQYIDRISWAMIRVIDEDSCTNDEIRKLPGRDLKDMICEFVSSIYNENIITENFWHTNEERLVYEQNNRNVTGQGRTALVIQNSGKNDLE
ncbi:Conserved_hypothetical protein [Hexamita inflata]|uniref:Uncharacterized protein n=1 Tax=Hexamita inflata TaxID=28002 RepID=A0AA86N7E1_9EUKA|nr:Conserved hypothetical protein [Hexamita inflata]